MSGQSGAGMLCAKRFSPQHSAPPIVLAAPCQSPYPILFTSSPSVVQMETEIWSLSLVPGTQVLKHLNFHNSVLYDL